MSEPTVVDVSQKFSRPAEGEQFYTLGEARFIRVTAVIDQIAKPNLFEWYAVQAAKRAASLLVFSGLAQMPKDDDKLQQFIDDQPWKELKPDDAIKGVMDWQDVAKEPLKFRDWRGLIGSLVHSAMYDDALGLIEGKVLDHMVGLAMKPVFWREHLEVVERYGELGVGVEELATKVAFAAKPAADSLMKTQAAFQFEWDVVGKEAPVFNVDEEFAGTQDGVCTVKRSVWSKATKEPWILDDPETGVMGPDTARCRCDFKTSKTLDVKGVGMQIAAYENCGIVYHTATDTAYENLPTDAAMALHALPGLAAKMKCWPASDYPALYAGFLTLLEYWRFDHDRPAPMKSRRKLAPRPATVTKGVARLTPTF